MLVSKIHYLRNFGFSNFVRKYATLSNAVAMHMQHDLRRLVSCLVEVALKNQNNELHRRVIIIQQQHPVHARFFRARLGTRDNGGTGFIVITTDTWTIIALARSLHCMGAKPKPRSTQSQAMAQQRGGRQNIGSQTQQS